MAYYGQQGYHNTLCECMSCSHTNNNDDILQAYMNTPIAVNSTTASAGIAIPYQIDEYLRVDTNGQLACINNEVRKITSRSSTSRKKTASADISALNCHFISNSSTSNSKAVETATFVHVRSRPGQATNTHSLAERARRNKINERMKILEDLVPGCHNIKIPNRAMVLEEIINYVKTLQQQVQVMCAKLATISPFTDVNADDLMFGKQANNI